MDNLDNFKDICLVFKKQEPAKTFTDQKEENDKYHLRLIEIKTKI